MLKATIDSCKAVRNEYDYPIDEVSVYDGTDSSFFCFDCKDSESLNEGIFIDADNDVVLKMSVEDVFSYCKYISIE